MGLPATTINWGQWSDVGLSRSLSYSAVDPITPAEGIEALESLAGSNLTRAGVARLRLDRALITTPEFRDLGYFDTLVGEFDTVVADKRSVVGDRDPAVAAPDWSQIPAENRIGELEIRLRAILARELRMPPSAIDVDQAVPRIGSRLDDGDDGPAGDASSWWASTCRRRCCGTIPRSRRWRPTWRKCLHHNKSREEDDVDMTLDSRAACWMSCSTVWNRRRPVVRAVSDENDLQQDFGDDRRPADRADGAVRQGLPYRGRGAGGGGGNRLPFPRWRGRTGGLLGVSGQRRGCDQRDPFGSLGRRRVLRPGPVRARPDVLEVGRFPTRCGRLRRRFLRDFPA